MTYKLYFMFQNDSERFDPDGLRSYAKWVEPQLGGNCLKTGVEISDVADPINAQTIFMVQYKALLWFEFTDLHSCFDSFQPNFVEILDKMEEFVDIPPLIHGCHVD